MTSRYPKTLCWILPRRRGAVALLTWMAFAGALVNGTRTDAAGHVRLVTAAQGGDTPAGTTAPALISADGRFVMLTSYSTGWLPALVDSNGEGDVVAWDQLTATATLVSHAAGQPTITANAGAEARAMSADGRFVAIRSKATNLIAGIVDSNDAPDCFLWDRDLDALQLLSMAAGGGTTGNGYCEPSSMSADGRFVTLVTGATDLIAGVIDGNSANDVYLWDRITASLRLISHRAGAVDTTGDAGASFALISADGETVSFASASTDLVAGGVDGNGAADAFVWRRESGETTLISHLPDQPMVTVGGATSPVAVSADGSFVLLTTSAPDAISGGIDGNAATDVVLWDATTAALILVSHAVGTPLVAANGVSQARALDASGRFVAFHSMASDITSGNDSNSTWDVFLWDRQTGLATLASRAAGGASAGNGASTYPGLDAAGRHVVFGSTASDLVAGGGDANGQSDVFSFDRLTGVVTLVSHVAGAPQLAGVGRSTISLASAISADGLHVAFASSAPDLAAGIDDRNGIHQDSFVWHRASDTTSLVSPFTGYGPRGVGGNATPHTLSADGRWVSFFSDATNVIDGIDSNGQNDIFLWDRHFGTATLVSHRVGAPLETANDASFPAATSTDGRYLGFNSRATNLISGYSGSDLQAYLYDRDTGIRTLVSRRPESRNTAANGLSEVHAISADGRYVLVLSNSTQLLDPYTGGGAQVFLWDRSTDAFTLVSRAVGMPAVAGNSPASARALSADGRFVTFSGAATNLVAGYTGSGQQTYLWDRDTGVNRLVSHQPGSSTAAAHGTSISEAVNADGRYVALRSTATNLVSGTIDTNGGDDVFLWDRDTNLVRLVTHSAASGTTAANGTSFARALSADGRYLLLVSSATDLVAGYTGSGQQAFLWDRDLDQMTLVSHLPGAATSAGSGPAFPRALSADGGTVLFQSSAANLVAGGTDTNGGEDVFRFRRATGTVELVSRVWSAPTRAGDRPSPQAIAVTPDGYHAILGSNATNLLVGDLAGSQGQGFLWSDLSTDTVAPSGVTIDATVPAVGPWSNDPTVEITWSGAVDDVSGLGLAGYSLLVDRNAATLPDTLLEVGHGRDPHQVTTAAVAEDAADWFVHLRACDHAGNCGPAAHAGPLAIDATPPTAPVAVSSPSHGDGQPHNDLSVALAWGAALDPSSGVAGYYFGTTTTADAPACASLTESTASTAATTGPLAEGAWYAHVCAQDVAGNLGPVATGGPFLIDTTPPRVDMVRPVAGGQTLADGGLLDTAVTQLLISFDEPMATTGSGPADLINYRLFAAGADGDVASTSCSSPAGDDLLIPLDAASYPVAPLTASLAVDVLAALVPDSYRLVACGDLTDVAGNLLDGDGNGSSGDAFTIDFSIHHDDQLVNPNLDRDLTGWQLSEESAGELSWQSADAAVVPSSGSLRLATATVAGEIHSVGQCVAASGGSHYRLRGRVRVASQAGDTPQVGLVVESFDQLGCQGAPLATQVGPQVSGGTGGAWVGLDGDISPPGATVSLRFSLVVDNSGGPPAFTVDADELMFYPFLAPIFADDLESGDTSSWTSSVEGP